MVHSMTTLMGADIERVDVDPSHALGTKTYGSEGREYIYVQASAAISSDTEVTITEPALTAAAGAGGFQSPVAAVAQDEYFWARDNTLT